MLHFAPEFTINPNGLIVGKTGVVKTSGSFVASTHNINNEDFMNGGDATFASGSQAGVDNLGTITSLAGDVTLIARKVRNEGQINAAKGTVGLAAGQEVLLRDGSFADGQLLVRVGGADDEITDSGTIRAAGAELRAAGGNIFALAGNAGGVITATGVAEQDGRIFLTAGDTGQIGADKQITASRGSDGGDITIQAGFVSLGGDIRADGQNGGSVAISGARVSLADTVSAAGTAGDGGAIEVAALGDSLVFETANVDASGSQNGGTIRHLTGADLTHSGTYRADGEAGDGGNIDIGGGATKLLSPTITANGGQVRIGGEFQGGKGLEVDELPNTQRLAVSTGTTISADGGAKDGAGDGGTVILWADENATILGDISARPGADAGEGGFIEVSAGSELKILSDNITAGGGTVLFDPRNIFIEDAADVDQSSFVLGHEFSSTVSLSSSLGAGDNFGAAVAIDGKRVAIGAPGDDARFGNLQDAGAVYLFTFDEADLSGGRLEAIVGRGYVGGKNFQPLNVGAGDRFGTALALDGNRLVVGAPGDDGFGNQTSNAGAVYLLNFAGDAFANLATRRLFGTGYNSGVSINVESDVGDGFGRAVALDGIDLAVGAPGDDGARNGRSNTGRVDVFELAFNGAELKSQIGAGYQDNVTFIPGSKGRPSSTRLNFSGIDTILRNGDAFGASLALDDRRVFIGAPGSDGFFGRRLGVGAVHHMKFNPDFSEVSETGRIGAGNLELYDLNMSALEADDRFGSAIAYSGERLAIGAAGDDGINNHRRNSGAVYLFDVPGGSTSQISFNSMIGRGYQEENTSGVQSTGVADLGGLDTFGASVAMDGTRLIVGAPNDDGEGNSASNVGKVYTFALEDGAQTALNNVNIIGDSHFGDGTALSLDAGDKLGMSVSLDQGRIVIGAEGDDGATNRVQDAGAVYLYSTGSDGLGDLTLEGIIGDGYVGGKNVNLTDLQAGDRFGAGVSLDGARLAVGAPGDDGGLNDNPDTGIVYLFTFNNSLFGNGTLDRTLGGDVRRRVDFQGNVSFGPIDRENFGTSVALQDNLLFVGSPGRGFGGSVEAFSFNFNEFAIEPFGSPFSLGLLGDNIPQNGSQPANRQINLDNGDAFGSSVAFDGTRLLVGAPGDDGAGNQRQNAGAVHAFDVQILQQQGKFNRQFEATQAGSYGFGYGGEGSLHIAGLDAGDTFGRSVAIDGKHAIVGAPLDDGAGNARLNSGAAYHISFSQFELDDPVLNGVIGAGYDGLTLSGRPNTNVEGLRRGDLFGRSVAIDGGQVAIGATLDDGSRNNKSASGSVRLFDLEREGITPVTVFTGIGKGSREAALTQNVGVGDAFGSAVALDDNRLAVGAPGDDGAFNNRTDAGAVYLYTFADAAFGSATLQSIIGDGYVGGKNINLANLEAGDRFGSSVALDQGRLAVGAANDDGANNAKTASGAAYLFNFATGAFGGGSLQAIVGDGYSGGFNRSLPLDRGDAFGAAVALDGNRLAIGAAGDDGNRNFYAESGAVYLYSFQQGNFFNLTRSNHTIGSNYESVQSFKGGARITTGVSVDGVRFGDRFGSSIALDGDKLVVGAFGSDGRVRFQSLLADERGPGGISQGRDSGSVFLMTLAKDNPLGRATLSGRLGLGWEGRFNPPSLQESSLTVRVGAGDAFGRSVAVDGDTLIVGAPGADGFGPETAGSGEVFRFTFAGDDYRGVELTGRYGARYDATPFSGGAAQSVSVEAGDRFGAAVALDGSRIVVGSPGNDGAGNRTANSGRVFLMKMDDAFRGTPVSQGAADLSPGKNVTITTERLERLLESGNDVVLLANNVISVRDRITVNRAPRSPGGDLTLIAGRSIFVKSDLTTDGGDLTLVANATEADGIVASDRLAGVGSIILNPNVDLRAGPAGSVTTTIGNGVPGAQRGRLVLQGNNTIGGQDVFIPVDALELGPGTVFTVFDGAGTPFSGDPEQTLEQGALARAGAAESGEQCDDIECGVFNTSALVD